MSDDEIARLRDENQAIHNEREALVETLVAMVRRGAKEAPPAFRKTLLLDLDTLLKESAQRRKRT